MRERFAQPQEEALTPVELGELLRRLHPDDFQESFERKDDFATVSAVCEATGHDPDKVWDALEDIRREDVESRLAQRLREAEEPLHRVERPGHETDPLRGANLLNRASHYETFLDFVQKKSSRPKVAKKFEVDRLSAILTTLIMFTVAVAFIGLLIYGFFASR